MRVGLFIFLVVFVFNSFSQTKKLDSLIAVLPEVAGIKKATILNDISEIQVNSNPELSFKYAEEALHLSEKNKHNEGIADAYNNMAYASLQLSQYEKTLEYSLKSLKIVEKEDNQIAGKAYNNIASAYLNLSNFKLAVANYLNAAKIYEKIGHKMNLATIYNNLAVSYDNRDILDTALMYYNKAFPIYREINDNRLLGLWYLNVGDLYRKQNKTSLALEYQLKAESLLIEVGDKFMLMVLYSGLPSTFIQKKEFNKALEYANKAVDLGTELKSPRELSYAFMVVAEVYAEKKDYKQQAEYLLKYVTLKDSIFSEETSRAITEMQSKYENDKKQKEIELLNKDKLLENEKHQNTRNIYIGIVLFASVLILILAIAFKNKNKANKILELQKKEIEKQKSIVDSKNKEIIDSINYAKRLQKAILATPDEINKHFSDNFLLYKPKDIVAGDFYFFETTNTHIFYAAADCTGHGVPGALVSVVCANALTRCVKEFHLTESGKILDKTRELVLETFAKSSADVKDGMDISFISIDKTSKKVQWSGANNPLWLVQNNELKEIKADKQPIGKTDSPTPFSTHEIESLSNTVFYLFTDGYADQFGGPKGKKFKYKQMEDLLLKNHALNFVQQSEILNQEFENWRGDLEQVDDVCVIGIKL